MSCVRRLQFSIILWLLLAPALACAAEVVLAWDYKVDPKVPIAGFRVYYGKTTKSSVKQPEKPRNETDPKPYEKVQTITGNTIRRATIRALDHGKYYFRVLVFTESGSTSVFSNEASVDIQPLKPPVGAKIVITISP